MKHPKVVAPQHSQTAPGSCVAWGTELVLLTFEKPLPSPSPQAASTGFGYVEAKKVLADAGIKSTVQPFGEDFGGFERAASAALRQGVFPIVTMPSFVYYDRPLQGLGLMFHTYAVYEEAGSLWFVTRGFNDNGPSYWTSTQFEKMRFEWAGGLKGIGFDTSEMLHTLFPEPLSP